MSHLIQALHMPLTLPVMQWPRTGRKQAATGEGRTEKGTRGGARRLARPLWARGRAAPQPTLRLGVTRPLQPRALTLRLARNDPYKLRPGGEFPGRRAATAAPTCAPPLGGAPVTGARRRTRAPPLSLSEAAAPWLAAPGLSQRPHLRGRGTAPARPPVRPPAGPRPLAALT